MSIDSHTFRETLGLFVTGVTIITTCDTEGRPVGITANSFNSVSLDPPLILWSVGLKARSLPAFQSANHYAVHILRDDQAELSQIFAKSGTDKFDGLDFAMGPDSIPLLPDCAARLVCTSYARHEAGDHILFIARVLSLIADGQAAPLVYHGGKYATLSDKPLDAAL